MKEVSNDKIIEGLTVKEVIQMLSSFDENLKCVIVAECGHFYSGLGRVRLEKGFYTKDDEYITFTSVIDMNCIVD